MNKILLFIIALSSTLAMAGNYNNDWLVQKFVKIKTTDELDSFITNLNNKYDELDDDVKLQAARFIPFQAYRGIVQKLSPIFIGSKVTRTMLRSRIRKIVQRAGIFMPQENWQIALDYLIEPYEGIKVFNTNKAKGFYDIGSNMYKSGSSDKRTGIEKFQDHLSAVVYPALSKATNRVVSLAKKDQVLEVDLRIVHGLDSYLDNANNHRDITPAVMWMLASRFQRTMHNIKVFEAYNFNDVIKVSKALGKLYGFDVLLQTEENLEGAPSFRRAEAIRKYPKYLTLRNGKALDAALKRYRLSNEYALKSIRYAKEKGKLAGIISEFSELFPTLTIEQGEEALEDIQRLLGDSGSKSLIKSQLTGKVLNVNMAAFYKAPYFKDLKQLMPTSWDNSPNTKILKKHGMSYPNYRWGRPTSWNYGAYQRIFGSDLKKAAGGMTYNVDELLHDLRYSAGGKRLASGLFFMVAR